MSNSQQRLDKSWQNW